MNLTLPIQRHITLGYKRAEFQVINDKAIQKFQVVRIEYLTVVNGKRIGDLNYLMDLPKLGFTSIMNYRSVFQLMVQFLHQNKLVIVYIYYRR